MNGTDILKRPPKAVKVLEQFLNEKIYSPAEMARLYELKYGIKITSNAFTVALRRRGTTAKELALLKKQKPKNNPKLCSCGRELSLFPKDIRICPYCGKELIPNRCSRCGKDLTAFPNDIVYCPFCSKIVSKALGDKASPYRAYYSGSSRYSEEENRIILDLHKSGKPNKEIARITGRTTKAIRARIKTLERSS